jgi:hypothetical protein
LSKKGKKAKGKKATFKKRKKGQGPKKGISFYKWQTGHPGTWH